MSFVNPPPPSKLEEEALARWTRAKGTPDTLLQAIRNGIDDIYVNGGQKLAIVDPEEIILKHVKERLAHIFNLYMSGNGDLIDTTAQAIWEKIIK